MIQCILDPMGPNPANKLDVIFTVKQNISSLTYFHEERKSVRGMIGLKKLLAISVKSCKIIRVLKLRE